MIKLEIKIAMKFLRSRAKDQFVSLITVMSFLGITIGVATLIVVTSVMTGFHNTLINRILGINGHITISVPGANIADFEPLVKTLETDTDLKQYIKTVVPIIQGQGLVVADNNNAGIIIRGVSQDNFNDIMQSSKWTTNFKNFDEGIAIGSQLFNRMNQDHNTKMTILSPNGEQTAFGQMPVIKNFDISSVFSLGMFEFDSSLVFMSLKNAMQFFNIEDSVTQLDIFLFDPNDISKAKPLLYKIISNKFAVYDWQQINASLMNALAIETQVMFVILLMIVIVAVFNIVASLTMLVKDKAKDIAVLMTLGMGLNSIRRIFLFMGMIIAVFGTIFGTIIGITISVFVEPIRQFVQKITNINLFDPQIYNLAELPAVVQLDTIILIVSISLTLSFLATLYPTHRATKIKPIQAIRDNI
ncbi:MAG: lipoprotein-releasing ABC transporter permease subunit [Alphaproteobacteria bacterium]|nr:lipoprotein-releasing ABC transporter permease subunit [Alphaproteobacteria bacterium]MBL0717819.1 lipoprotein-releasing ABC transporter permease subunit [Alphaproteobacteria bacterium]